MIERHDLDSWRYQAGHIYRYRLAADLILEGETVLDVASGIGYGAELLQESKKISYIGVDKIPPAIPFIGLGAFIENVDLEEWQPNFDWDVSVSFETLEHLANPEHLANILKRARRLIIISTPTRPTKHFNEFHLQDFTVDDVLALFADCELVHIEDQPEELSHIFVFKVPDA